MIILPSVLYGLHVVWGGCLNVDLLNSLEILHRRVARVIYNLPRARHAYWHGEVCRRSKLHTLTFYSYKLQLIKMLHSVFIGEAPAALSYLTNKPCKTYNFTKSTKMTVPRFNSYFLKNSISYKGVILWNAFSTHFTGQFTDFYRKVKKDFYLRNLVLTHD